MVFQLQDPGTQHEPGGELATVGGELAKDAGEDEVAMGSQAAGTQDPTLTQLKPEGELAKHAGEGDDAAMGLLNEAGSAADSMEVHPSTTPRASSPLQATPNKVDRE